MLIPELRKITQNPFLEASAKFKKKKKNLYIKSYT